MVPAPFGLVSRRPDEVGKVPDKKNCEM